MAFVHLHNHSDFSILDAATRVNDMVKRAVDLKMPALALTDHGYLFGIPDFDLACRKYNDAQKDMQQWRSDLECFQKNWNLEEPPADALDAGEHDRMHRQWESDTAVWNKTHDIEAVKANKPHPLIKPIFGCEAYFITNDCIERGTKQTRYHLILLAKNETGYVNLMKMMSEAASKEMFYFKPRTTLDMLRRYHEGIICTSACVSGIIPRSFFAGQPEEAERWALIYKEIFGDDFYLEVQDHGLSDPNWNGFTDRTLSEQILNLGHKLNIKVVATNDNHYLTREDASVQDIASCIGTGSKFADANRKRMSGNEFYFKTEEEMREIFSWAPEVIDNTLEVADKCNYELDWTHMYLPKFPDLAEGETSEERFRKECEEGLARRYGENWREVEISGINVKERFEYEYDIICKKGFADYFLIVQEYVRWAKQNGIGVGPGRGSAAGAIVAYAMDITTFDPLENGLMFERFLSPQRSEMPDIDMDFDDERRLEVVEHVRQLYGPERVSHVITYSTIKAKQAINDACRVLDYPVYQGQRLSKMISNDPKAQLSKVLHKGDGEKNDLYNPDFEEAYNTEEASREIIDAALAIEGLHRGEGVHACAVLIAPTPVNDHVPTKMDTKGEVEITQFEGHSVADMGLLKMDFLGLRTLTVISRALKNIKANFDVDINVDEIPFEDPEIYRLMREGRTSGVFQIESAGMTATIKGMRPTEFKHIVALIALYRPGPLGAGMVSSYIDRMNGREEPVDYDPRLHDILAETYGTMVYQEQVMQISMKMSGFTAGESDKVRKAVAKKKIKLMQEVIQHWDDGADETMEQHWKEGAVRNGFKRETAEIIWEDVLKFASYAFNKSHSAGYAILVMQTAWLKAHYPHEYMAAVLTSFMGKTDKIVHYVSACRQEGIKVSQPDINESGRDFTATKEGIRFGFAGIRGVGAGVAEAIMAERQKKGPFSNLRDFIDRMDASQAKRNVVEALIKAGAFDSTGYTRMQLMKLIDKSNPENILDSAAKRQRDKASGQISMFDLFSEVEGSGFTEDFPDPDGVEWERRFKLSQEYDVLGIYVSDHPLTPYAYALSLARDYELVDIDATEEYRAPDGGIKERFKVPEGENIRLSGMVTNIQKRITKNGDPMAIVTLEDMEGELSLVLFPKAYKKYASTLAGSVDPETGETQGDVIVGVFGKLERSDRGTQFICSGVTPIELNETNKRPRVLEIQIPVSKFSRANYEMLSQIFNKYRGNDCVELRIESTQGDVMRMEIATRVDARNMAMITELSYVLGEKGFAHVV